MRIAFGIALVSFAVAFTIGSAFNSYRIGILTYFVVAVFITGTLIVLDALNSK